MSVSSQMSQNAEKEEENVSYSPSVADSLSSLKNYRSLSAVDFAYEILSRHSEYGKGNTSFILPLLVQIRNGQQEPSTVLLTEEELINEVSVLFNLQVVKVIHGRLALIGLCMLDATLRSVLIQQDFVFDLIDEVAEPLTTILSETGLKGYDVLMSFESRINDDVENQGDASINNPADDKLNRFEFARFLVKLLNNTRLDKGSFSMHIYAPWGAGKSSVMNFMKQLLEDGPNGQQKWQVVYFNAWQNQGMPHPWWTLMNTIYSQVKKKLPVKRRIFEWYWRFRIKWLPYIFMLLSVFVLFAVTWLNEKDIIGTKLEDAIKVAAALAALISTFFALGKKANSSEKAAQAYLDSNDDPMNMFKDKFDRLIKDIKPIAIFIDDLDRCKSAYVVNVLENIQTLFKESNVVFVVAADKKWIHASYEVEYDCIKSFVGTEGKSIGPLFVEKMFQLSVALPGVASEIKQQLWESMLGTKTPQTSMEPEAAEPRNKSQSFEKNHANRLKLLDKMADKKSLAETEHFLSGYSAFLDLNPRNMKGLLNNYTVNKAASLLSHIDVEPHQLILWTILSMRWPALGTYMLTCAPEKMVHKNTPADILDLFDNCDVKKLLAGAGKAPLSLKTLLQCRQLFM